MTKEIGPNPSHSAALPAETSAEEIGPKSAQAKTPNEMTGPELLGEIRRTLAQMDAADARAAQRLRRPWPLIDA